MKKIVIVAVIISSIAALVMNLAIELTADDLKPWFEGRAWLVYLILGITFFVVLAVTIYLLREQAPSSNPETPADIVIEDTVSSGGKIEGSPIQVHRDSKASIKRTVDDKGTIKDSGTTIK